MKERLKREKVVNKELKINNIYNLDVLEFLEKVPNGYADLVVIDPPYNLKKGDWDNFKNEKEFLDFTYNYLEKCIPKIKEGGSLYIFNTAYNSAFILKYLLDLKMIYQNWIVWYKKDGFSACKKKYVNNQETILYFTKGKNSTFNYDDIREPYSSKNRIEAAEKKGIIKNGKRWFPNSKGKLCTDVWEYTSVRLLNKVNGKTIKQEHPTPKPELMLERIIKASSNKKDVVMDLFSGTGTTSVIAKKLGRNYIGCEIDKNYCKLIEKRLKNVN